jgi:hypothetical protein
MGGVLPAVRSHKEWMSGICGTEAERMGVIFLCTPVSKLAGPMNANALLRTRGQPVVEAKRQLEKRRCCG